MHKGKIGYLMGVLGTALAVVVLLPFREHLNSAPIALTFLLIVLLTATGYGSSPAFVASIVSLLCFNFFFIPPYHTFRIADPQNWITLGAFLATSLIAGGLSARERRRAEEAEIGKKEIERLYAELRDAFEKASQAEAIKQSEQLKSALLDAVSHDLRTPLTSMKAAVTTLLGTTPNSTEALDEEGYGEMLEVINAEIDRLNRLLEGLIEIAKIEAGAMEPRRGWVNAEEFISIALTRSSGLTARHRVRVDLEKDLPLIRVDEKAMAEALYVLIENAAKYSPTNTEILIIARKKQDNVEVSVEDHGVGIPLELREKVFEKFFRFSKPENTSRQRPAGLGMGLAIARGIVEAHKGRIWIENSSTGNGTRISFTIPIKQDEVPVG